MAKSFKQLTSTVDLQKRTSEKDFLDFLDQERTDAVSAEATSSGKKSIRNNTKNIDTHNNTGKTSNIKNVSSTSKPVLLGNTKSKTTEAGHVTSVTEDVADVRQTFIIGQHYLDRLKDYVHTRRVSGQYEYTQKQALHDALDLLFEGAVIAARPEHIRQQEEVRKQRIRRGIPK